MQSPLGGGLMFAAFFGLPQLAHQIQFLILVLYK